MVCPRCNGTGRVQRSFLGFRWTSACPHCRRWPSPSGPSVGSLAGFDSSDPPPSASPSAVAPSSWSGGGGRSGGAGASASWDAAPAPRDSDSSLPLIVDPFADSPTTGPSTEADAAAAAGETAAVSEDPGTAY